MSADYLADSSVPVRYFCPTCEPEVDISREIAAAHWCDLHAPAITGAEDGKVEYTPVSGTAEAGGDVCRRMQALIT